MNSSDSQFLQRTLILARRGYGKTSPNPMVGAVLVKSGRVIGEGWHHRAGLPHAEIEALRAASENPKGATLYVSLEPCCTHGRTPPCTDAVLAAGIKRVVVAGTDPNPAHNGKGLALLRRNGVSISHGVLAEEESRLNEVFRHWIVCGQPFVTVKAAMSLDGKIATRRGESKWITGETSRRFGMKLRAGADAILVGVNTIIADDPSLTVRKNGFAGKHLHRFVLDPCGRIPANARVLNDEFAELTTVVVAQKTSRRFKRASVLAAPMRKGRLDLSWLLNKLGDEQVTGLLVEGGGETNASFLLGGFAQRVAFFYAPMIIGGRSSPKGVAGLKGLEIEESLLLREVEYKRLGADLLLTARVAPATSA